MLLQSVFFAFVIVTIFSEGEPQSWQGTFSPQNDLINFLFPKNPNLVKVRKMEQISGSDAVVLDFVSIKIIFG